MKIVLAKNFNPENFGEIYVYSEKHNVCFPSDDWEDFYENIIFDWYFEVLKHQSQTVADFRLWFMEGVYYILVSKSVDDCMVIGIDNCDEILFFEKMSYSTLVKVIADSALYLFENNNCIDPQHKRNM